MEVSVFWCQERRAIMACPPGECRAPVTKSGWPPNPEWIRLLMKLAFDWANRSTCIAALTERTALCAAMRDGSLTVSVRRIRRRSLQSAHS